MLSGWESLTPPGRDTSPSQVCSQQTLVLIYLPRKDEKLSWLRRKRRTHNDSNFGRAGIEPGTFWIEGRDLTNCAQFVSVSLQSLTKLYSLYAKKKGMFYFIFWIGYYLIPHSKPHTLNLLWLEVIQALKVRLRSMVSCCKVVIQVIWFKDMDRWIFANLFQL